MDRVTRYQFILTGQLHLEDIDRRINPFEPKAKKWVSFLVQSLWKLVQQGRICPVDKNAAHFLSDMRRIWETKSFLFVA